MPWQASTSVAVAGTLMSIQHCLSTVSGRLGCSPGDEQPCQHVQWLLFDGMFGA
jgi:hypothetical protein